MKLAGGNKLAIYMCGGRFEFRLNEKKSLQWPEQNLTRNHRIASPTHWPLGHTALAMLYILIVDTNLCSYSTWRPLVPNFCSQATRKLELFS